MDWIHKFMNIVLLPITVVILLFLFPLFLVFKLTGFMRRSIFSENMAGKVVLITGASSGIGEHLAYEYAKRGARLGLAARRESKLQAVANKARQLGSPDVIVICVDVSKVEDCRSFIQEALNHFGRLDHLVNNAGISQFSMFEDSTQISDFAAVMNTNFWGSVYVTHFAVPHLRKSKGRIVAIASTAGWLPVPKLSFYNASKAAQISFYETLRTEFGSDIGITIVNPGLIESEMTHGDIIPKLQMGNAEYIPVESTQGCAKAIVNSACRGDMNVTEPSWVRVFLLLKLLCPELLDWTIRLLFLSRPTTTKKSA